MSGHPEVRLTAPGGRPVLVDVGIARLVSALWRAGAETGESCMGDDRSPAYVTGDRRMVDVLLDACAAIALTIAAEVDTDDVPAPAVVVSPIGPSWWVVELAPPEARLLAASVDALAEARPHRPGSAAQRPPEALDGPAGPKGPADPEAAT